MLEKMKAFANLMGEENTDLTEEMISRAIKQISPIQRKELIRELEQAITLSVRQKALASDWHDPVSMWLTTKQPKAIR